MREVGYLQGINRDARSAKHKKKNKILLIPVGEKIASFNFSNRRRDCACMLILPQQLCAFRIVLLQEKKKFGCHTWINVGTLGVKFLGNGPLET